MNQGKLRNRSFQEGLLFLLLGGTLLWYSLDSHGKSFNKDWAQSPYLFPLIVAVLFGILSISLLVQGVLQAQTEGTPQAEKLSAGQWGRVLVILLISLAYYFAMAVLKIPYITFGIFAWSLTISNFEVVSLIFLIVMMLYLGVRKPAVLVLVPFGTTLFLSIAFRAMLHILLP